MDASAGIGSISPTSRFVRDAVAARVEATRAKDVETLATPLGATCVEFDDVRYAVTSVADERGGRVRVDVSVGAPGGAFEERRAMEDAATLICLSDGTIAANEKANAGYDATFRVDVSAIASLEDEARREEIVQRVSRVRNAVYGAKLRGHLRELAATGGTEGALDWSPRRRGETMFIKPQNDQVTVIFPMHFADARDAVIATQFLTQFAEVRRGQKELSTAPAVSYHKSPPLELKDAPEEMIGDANGGYVSFVLFKRHATPDRLEATVWNIMTFHAFVSYHIKYSKAYWHSRMRQKVESWLSILKRAKKVDPSGNGEEDDDGGRADVRAQVSR